MKKKKIMIGLPGELLEQIDKDIESSTFVTRLEFIRHCIRQELSKRGFDE